MDAERQNPRIRAADADREAMAERLRRHHAEGRLDGDEFQERLDRCYGATTLGQLGELVRDLPPEPGATRRLQGVRGLGCAGRAVPLLPLAALALVAAVAAAHAGLHALWLVWPVLLVLVLTRAVRRPAPPA